MFLTICAGLWCLQTIVLEQPVAEQNSVDSPSSVSPSQLTTEQQSIPTTVNIGGKVKKVSDLTAGDVARLSDEVLLSLPMEEMMALADKLGISIDQLLNIKTSVASKKGLSTRESPAIITVITNEEIQNSGARDLVDVLQMVPGFAFGYDVEGAIGIGTRGMWGHEGKVLLMIDGQEMNELAFSTLQFGMHFDVSQIKRIEILRGPGSSIYGGFAELSVINLITKSADDYNGIALNTTYGQMSSNMGLGEVGFGGGKCYPKFNFSLSGSSSTGNRFDQPYADFTSNEYTIEQKIASFGTAQVNAALNAGDFSSRLIFDFYRMYTADFLEDKQDKALNVDFYSYLGEAKYTFHPSDKWSIIPRINVKYQLPWNNTSDTTFGIIYYDKSFTRGSVNLTSSFDVNDRINIQGGLEEFVDHGVSNQPSEAVDPFPNGHDSINYFNSAVFAQALFKYSFVNFTIGGRYDYHNEFGGAFSPRLALTGIINNFHYKTLFSMAFRAPGFENILGGNRAGTTIKPEKTTVFELELGYRITANMFLTANLFDISILDPIVYFYDDVDGLDKYLNYDKTGSNGLELEYRCRYNWGYLTAGYSYYNAAPMADNGTLMADHFEKNSVDDYTVPGNPSELLGFAQHKLTISTCFIARNVSINPSLVYLSKRHAWGALDSVGVDENGDVIQEDRLTEIDPTLVFNIYLRYKDAFVKGLSLGAGVFDVFGQQPDMLSPYPNGHPPYPGLSREFVVSLSYDFNL